MRYSFLDILACPFTREPLSLLGGVERDVFIPEPYIEKAKRVSPRVASIGPLPAGFAPTSDLGRALQAHASGPDAPGRNEHSVVWDGILVAPNSGRWYPIIDGLPEILPDSLRDWQRDRAHLEQVAARLPQDVSEKLINDTSWIDTSRKSGDNYKHSEITLLNKVDDLASFLGPGHLSPFNPYAYDHSSAFLKGFSCCLPFLQLQQGDYVLDSGSGYSWTTEWFMKMGIRGVGLEINRTYLDVGRQRMGSNQPHLIIADAENLPFVNRTFDAVLGFDAFHHIPNRPNAMKQFSNVLKSTGRIVLVEPGAAHEQHEVSQSVMQKYGTMEVGMTLADVRGYVAGIPAFGHVSERFILPFDGEDRRPFIDINEIKENRSFLGWSLFTIEHAAAA